MRSGNIVINKHICAGCLEHWGSLEMKQLAALPWPHRPGRIALAASPRTHHPGRIDLAALPWPHHPARIALAASPRGHHPGRIALAASPWPHPMEECHSRVVTSELPHQRCWAGLPQQPCHTRFPQQALLQQASPQGFHSRACHSRPKSSCEISNSVREHWISSENVCLGRARDSGISTLLMPLSASDICWR